MSEIPSEKRFYVQRSISEPQYAGPNFNGWETVLVLVSRGEAERRREGFERPTRVFIDQVDISDAMVTVWRDVSGAELLAESQDALASAENATHTQLKQRLESD